MAGSESLERCDVSEQSVPMREVRHSYHNRQSNQAQNGIEYQDRPTSVVFISDPCSSIHKNRSEDKWWCYKALGSRNAETHAFSQNYR